MAATGEKKAEVERDTDDPETCDLHQLLLPPPENTLPSNHRRFAVAYNAGMLQGWVRQTSPACAAGKERKDRAETKEP
jgi:hypothetical protein